MYVPMFLSLSSSTPSPTVAPSECDTALTRQSAGVSTGRESQEIRNSSAHKLQVSEAVGCLTARAKGAWDLTKATELRAVERSSANGRRDRTYRLMGLSIFNPSDHADHKVRVQGLPVKDGINVTSLAMLSEDCTK
jgi:hypothetical protein